MVFLICIRKTRACWGKVNKSWKKIVYSKVIPAVFAYHSIAVNKIRIHNLLTLNNRTFANFNKIINYLISYHLLSPTFWNTKIEQPLFINVVNSTSLFELNCNRIHFQLLCHKRDWKTLSINWSVTTWIVMSIKDGTRSIILFQTVL